MLSAICDKRLVTLTTGQKKSPDGDTAGALLVNQERLTMITNG